MTARYRVDAAHSRFTVQAFRTGMVSFLGHNPTFAVRHFDGEIRRADEELGVLVTAESASLELLDNVSLTDRNEIEARMRGEVLDAAHYPRIAFEGSGEFAGKVNDTRARFTVHGRLSLHGTAHALDVNATLGVVGDRVGLGCAFALPMSAYGIPLVTALGGTIRLKDEVHVAFDLVGQRLEGDA